MSDLCRRELSDAEKNENVIVIKLTMLGYSVVIFLSFAVFTTFAAEPETAGSLKRFAGEVFLITELHTTPRKLDPDRDQYRPLSVGETLRLGSDAHAELIIGDEHINKDGPCEYTVLAVESAESSETMKAIEHFASTGGRTRGGPTHRVAVFAPAPEEVIWPPELVIRWIPKSNAGSVSFTVLDEDDEILWQKEGVPDAAGVLDSEDLRKALAEHEGSFVLNMRRLDEMITVQFTVLSSTQKGALENELSAWDRESDQGFRSIGRAYVYRKFRMFNHVANEYEAALKNAPRSRSLLIAAVLAQHRTGNVPREKEIRIRLPADVNQKDLE
jgi:hypothetical protein